MDSGNKINLAEVGFDPTTFGLWAQHASSAPLCTSGINSVVKIIPIRKCEDNIQDTQGSTITSHKKKWRISCSVSDMDPTVPRRRSCVILDRREGCARLRLSPPVAKCHGSDKHALLAVMKNLLSFAWQTLSSATNSCSLLATNEFVGHFASRSCKHVARIQAIIVCHIDNYIGHLWLS